MGSLLSLHLFLLLLTHFTSNSFSLCNHHDTSSLLQFKNSFALNTSSKPDSLDILPACPSFSFKTESWKNSEDCCKWDGVTCDKVSDNVIGLDLSCNNLVGELHPNSTIFQLRHLQHLNLAFNDFSMSSLHVGVGDLVNLKYLNLSYSNLSGNIPSTISHLSKLVSLDLSYDDMKLNPFTWKKLIHNATNLRELYLDYVHMSSIRENSLSMLNNLSSSLVSLSLQNTKLQGNLSAGILSLPNLQLLDLSSYDLSVTLAKSNWSTSLRYLDLSGTYLSSGLPYSIGHLKSLTHLHLSECRLDGLIPPSFFNLTQLTFLDLSYNNFEGQIPLLLSKLTQLTFLDLSINYFEGEIPLLLSKLTHLTSLDLTHNKFSGNVPNIFENLIKLEYLSLSSNNLIGPIPTEITKHSKLKFVYLSENLLNGTIPRWCYYLPSLLELDLSNNNLTGFIDEFSTYSLEELSLSNNNLHGQFPNSIFQLQNLTDLVLSSINLCGAVDFHKFSKLKKLNFLSLSHNRAFSINSDNKYEVIFP